MDYTVRERITLDVNFRWFMVDYKDDPQYDQFDRDDYTIAGTFFYRIMPKTSLLGEVDYVHGRATTNPAFAVDRDSDGWRFWLGVKGDLTAKTTILLKLGWEWKDYENPARKTGTDSSPKATLSGSTASLRRSGSSAVAQTSSRRSRGRTTTSATYGGVEVRHFLSERLIVRVRALGGVNHYPEDVLARRADSADRNDVFFEAGVSLKYQMRRWLAFELGYNFLNLNSNFNEFDYTDNRIKASVLFSY